MNLIRYQWASNKKNLNYLKAIIYSWKCEIIRLIKCENQQSLNIIRIETILRSNKKAKSNITIIKRSLRKLDPGSKFAIIDSKQLRLISIMDIKVDDLPISKFQQVCSAIKSWQFVYLVLFAVGLILPIAWTDTSDYSGSAISLAFTAAAFLVKFISMIFKNKPSFRQLIRMQWSFIIPYIMMVINLVLGIQPYLAFSQSLIFNSVYFSINWYLLGALNNIKFALSTIICSLIMDSRVRKFQFYGIFCLILILTYAVLYQNINLIKIINSASDSLSDAQNEILLQLINGQMTQQEYSVGFDIIDQFQSTFDSAKDYGLASIASVIAQLLIMLDLISRPQEQAQKRQQLYQGLKSHLGLRKSDRQIQLTLLTHRCKLKKQLK